MENKELQVINKADVGVIASALLNKLDNGEVNPLIILSTVKAYEKVFEKIKKDLINYALTEAEKYGEKEFELNGVKFTKMEAGTSYDYSNCGHADYNEICNQIKTITEKRKDYEKLLLSIKETTPIVMPSGEVCEVYPPAKKSTSTLKVSL